MLELATIENGLVNRPDIDGFEDVLNELPKFDCPTTHHFIGGFYIRQIRMPKGFHCVTKIHAKRHSFQITEGEVEVITPDGHRQLLVAPYVGITEAGTRRALRVLEDCTWTTFHATDAQTPEEAEAELIIPQYREGIHHANARNQHEPLLHE